MPDERKPPEPEKALTDEEVEEHAHAQRAAHAELARTAAESDLEILAGHCFDMGAALRAKMKAIAIGDLRADILAAHQFNEAARQCKRMLAVVDRSHKRYLEANPDVGDE